VDTPATRRAVATQKANQTHTKCDEQRTFCVNVCTVVSQERCDLLLLLLESIPFPLSSFTQIQTAASVTFKRYMFRSKTIIVILLQNPANQSRMFLFEIYVQYHTVHVAMTYV
jgi:hypothetical protein